MVTGIRPVPKVGTEYKEGEMGVYTDTVKAAEIPVVDVNWTVKGIVFVIVSIILSWLLFTPVLLLSAIGLKGMFILLGLEAG